MIVIVRLSVVALSSRNHHNHHHHITTIDNNIKTYVRLLFENWNTNTLTYLINTNLDLFIWKFACDVFILLFIVFFLLIPHEIFQTTTRTSLFYWRIECSTYIFIYTYILFQNCKMSLRKIDWLIEWHLLLLSFLANFVWTFFSFSFIEKNRFEY